MTRRKKPAYEPEHPLWEALFALTGSRPPDFTQGVNSSAELSDYKLKKLKSWCKDRAHTEWAVPAVLIELADHIVKTAEAHGKIPKKETGLCTRCVPCAGTATCVHCGGECPRDGNYKLSDGIREQGFEVVICAKPGLHEDYLGDSDASAEVQALKDKRIAICADDWKYAEGAAHEISEVRHGFKHSKDMLWEQSHILAEWHSKRSEYY